MISEIDTSITNTHHAFYAIYLSLKLHTIFKEILNTLHEHIYDTE